MIHTKYSSRADAFFGNNHLFNATVFAETQRYWTNETLTSTMLANSKLARQVTSRAFNPEYTFTASTEQFSLGEVSAPIIAFGDLQKGTVERDLVEYFFGEYLYFLRIMKRLIGFKNMNGSRLN